MDIAFVKSVVASLLAWINIEAGLEVPDRTPVVAFVPRASLELMACKGPCPILGLYPGKGVVYVDGDLALETNICARSVLLHELVHYMQDKARRFAEYSPELRWQMRELEAHQIQSQFLTAHGIRGGTNQNVALHAFMGPSC